MLNLFFCIYIGFVKLQSLKSLFFTLSHSLSARKRMRENGAKYLCKIVTVQNLKSRLAFDE